MKWEDLTDKEKVAIVRDKQITFSSDPNKREWAKKLFCNISEKDAKAYLKMYEDYVGEAEKIIIIGYMIMLEDMLRQSFVMANKGIEKALQAQLILALAHKKGGKFAHQEQQNFNTELETAISKIHKTTAWKYLYHQLKNDNKSLDKFIPKLNFTHCVNMFEMLVDRDDKKAIAKHFNYDDVDKFTKDINIINRLRNMCAHYNWNNFNPDDFKNCTVPIPLYECVKIIGKMIAKLETSRIFWMNLCGILHTAESDKNWSVMLKPIYGFPEDLKNDNTLGKAMKATEEIFSVLVEKREEQSNTQTTQYGELSADDKEKLKQDIVEKILKNHNQIPVESSLLHEIIESAFKELDDREILLLQEEIDK